jgi:hypothetical protein
MTFSLPLFYFKIMAIGTLVPKLRACWTNNCKSVEIYDTTLPYNAVTNIGGWGPVNIDASALDSATITYTTPSASDSVTVDVTTAVNAQTTVTDEFLLTTINLTETDDGQWTFLYTCTEAGTSVTYEISVYSTCAVRCCVDKLWAKSAKELLEDCGCSGSSVPYTDKAHKGEGLIHAIHNGASCNDTATKDALLAKLQRICNLENCNCN